jgi:hypothetical protein
MKKVRITIRFTEKELEDIQNLKWYKKQTASQIIREAVQFMLAVRLIKETHQVLSRHTL